MKKIICLLSLAMLAGCSGFPSERVGASDKKPLTPKQEVQALAGDTKAWLDRYEPKLKAAIEGSGFTLERRRNVLAVSMPVQGGFNPDRPQMLMPAKLGPLTRLAKLAEQHADAAVLVLGHADTTLEKAIGFIAVALGAGNAAGGYVVTERMLEMFKSSKKPAGGE